MSANPNSYSQQLLLALRLHDVPGPQIAEALAEVESHVLETGQTEVEAFGEPKEYAAALARELGAPTTGTWRGLWREVRWWHAVVAVLSYAGAVLLIEGATGLGTGDAGIFGLPALACAVLGAGLLAVLAVAFVRALRSGGDPVRDPRTGVDVAPPIPRRLIVLMVAVPCVPLVVAIVFGIVTRSA